MGFDVENNGVLLEPPALSGMGVRSGAKILGLDVENSDDLGFRPVVVVVAGEDDSNFKLDMADDTPGDLMGLPC